MHLPAMGADVEESLSLIRFGFVTARRAVGEPEIAVGVVAPTVEARKAIEVNQWLACRGDLVNFGGGCWLGFPACQPCGPSGRERLADWDEDPVGKIADAITTRIRGD